MATDMANIEHREKLLKELAEYAPPLWVQDARDRCSDTQIACQIADAKAQIARYVHAGFEDQSAA